MEFLYGFLGVILGASISLLGSLITSRHRKDSELIKAAAELGINDFREARASAKEKEGGALVSPAATFVMHHYQILRELDRKGRITDRAMKRIRKNDRQIGRLLEQIQNQHH